MKQSETTDKNNLRAKKVIALLRDHYPEAKCSLDYKNPLQLLIATILSAQCTDERVNKVTPALFARYKSAKDFASTKISDLEEMIRTTGFFRNKAKSIKECCKVLVEKYKGQVPRTMDELFDLPGVGRKTANVVLGNAYGIPGMVVDTHIGRVSHRLGFAKGANPVMIEQELEKVIPKEDWVDFTHLLIAHGRAICTARIAHCGECFLARLCPKLVTKGKIAE